MRHRENQHQEYHPADFPKYQGCEELLLYYDKENYCLTPWEGDNSRQRERIEVPGLIADIKKATAMTNRDLGVRLGVKGYRETGNPRACVPSVPSRILSLSLVQGFIFSLIAEGKAPAVAGGGVLAAPPSFMGSAGSPYPQFANRHNCGGFRPL